MKLPGISFDICRVGVDCSTVLGGTFNPTLVPFEVLGEVGDDVNGVTDVEVEGTNGVILAVVVGDTVVGIVVFAAVNKES